MAGYIEQPRTAEERDAAGMNKQNAHIAFEHQLRKKLADDKTKKEEEERRKIADAEAAAAEERARLAAEEAARPKPTGPPMPEFLALVTQAVDKEAKIGLLKGRAADLFKQGFPKDATQLYTSAIVLQPTHTLHGNRSACRCATGDYAGALEDAMAALRLDSKWAKGYVRQGAALHGLCRFDQAISAYEAGLKVEPGNAALTEGLADAVRRRQAAGGQWDVVIDGGEIVNHYMPNEGSVEGPRLGFALRDEEKKASPPIAPFAQLCKAYGEYVVVSDGTRLKLYSIARGCHVVKEFNEQVKDSGAYTWKQPPSGVAIDATGRDPCLYAVLPNKSHTLFRLLIRDTRAQSSRAEKPDKVMHEEVGKRVLGLDTPKGLALVDTSRMGGGGYGDSTLYVCDAGNGRLLALEPKELQPRFSVGRPGAGDGELDDPVAVCACGDLLAIADAGNYRVCLFTLRGTYVRSLGEKASKFARNPPCGHFVRPPAHVAFSPGHVFVLEDAGSRIHVLDPRSGAPLGLLHPPFGTSVPTSAKGALDPSGARGCLTGLCVDEHALYVGSNCNGHSRLLRLPRAVTPPPPPTSDGHEGSSTPGSAAAEPSGGTGSSVGAPVAEVEVQ